MEFTRVFSRSMRWSVRSLMVLALPALALAIAACGGASEPETVEVVVEKEVVKEVPVEVIVEKEVEVPVEVVKEVPVEVIVEKEVEVPVQVVKEVPVEVIVERVVEVPVQVVKEVPVEVIVEKVVEVPVQVVVEKVVEVPVEVIVEKVVEVPVEVTKEVEVVVTPTPMPAPTAIPSSSLAFQDGNLTLSASDTGSWGMKKSHTCGLRRNGTIVCWGNGDYGQLSAPSGKFKAISAGTRHTCALSEVGEIVCWGDNDAEQARAPSSGKFKAISAGHSHSCALRENGEAVCWGAGNTPPQGGIYKAISAGYGHTCALRENGYPVCWGREDGRSGMPDGKFIAISAGGDSDPGSSRGGFVSHTCALRDSGEAVCWGRLGYGAGDAPSGKFKGISAGGLFTCGLREDGYAQCWGRLSSSLPEQFTTISAGGYHVCGSLEDGRVECWGENNHGQASPPSDRFAHPSATANTRTLPSNGSFDAASILTRFSTDDAAQGEERADAASEILARYRSGKPDATRILDLLHTLAPELSVEERRRAADELARISDDDEWDEAETSAAVNHLATLAAFLRSLPPG